MRRLSFGILLLLLFGACGKRVRVASPSPRASTPSASSRPGTSTPPRIMESDLTGIASYYAEPYHGRRTANGEVFDTYEALTAAHRTLAFNTVVRVTNEKNGKDVDVRINDRGPFIDGRVIDLSLKAAREIDMVRDGIVPVKLKILKDGTPPRVSRAAPAPPAARQPASGAPVSTPDSEVYAVQVGAFDTEDAADSLRRELEKRYMDVIVQTFSTTRTFYRVRVGRAPDLATAERLAKQLRQDSLDPFVVRLN